MAREFIDFGAEEQAPLSRNQQRRLRRREENQFQQQRIAQDQARRAEQERIYREQQQERQRQIDNERRNRERVQRNFEEAARRRATGQMRQPEVFTGNEIIQLAGLLNLPSFVPPTGYQYPVYQQEPIAGEAGAPIYVPTQEEQYSQNLGVFEANQYDLEGVFSRRASDVGQGGTFVDLPPRPSASFAKGGEVPFTMHALVHQGELVIPRHLVAGVRLAAAKAGIKI